MKINKKIKKIKVTENDFKDFSCIATIPKDFKKSMVLYITTWQEAPDDNQKVVKFMSNQDKRWKEQHEFNKKQH